MGTRTTARQGGVRGPLARGFRRGRGEGGTHHDPYDERAKPPSPCACPQCGLVHRKGRWSRGVRPPQARSHLCPACRRIRDRYPAGFVRLEGDLGPDAEEFLQLIRHHESAEAEEHPLERVIEILQADGSWTVTTTGLHLPRRLAGALRRAGHGAARIRYGKAEQSVRATVTSRR